MHFPLDIHLFGSTIQAHLLFDVIAAVAAYKYFTYLKKKRNEPILSDENEFRVIMGLAIGALIGSRLLAALEHPYLFIAPPSWAYYFFSKTILGGVLGGIVGVEITKYIFKIKRRTGDLFAYPLILAIAIGRIGCFLTGVSDGTAGLPSRLPWALDQGDGILRHPTALYEIMFLLLLWGALRTLERKVRLQEGDIFYLFVVAYSAFRLCVEFIKPIEHLALGLSAIQIAALAAVVYYGLRFLKERKTR